jgi:hypothetical protein
LRPRFGSLLCAIDVDDLSLLKWETEPVRVRFQCRYPERIKGSVQVFVNGEGFTVGVQAKRGPRGGSGGGQERHLLRRRTGKTMMTSRVMGLQTMNGISMGEGRRWISRMLKRKGERGRSTSREARPPGSRRQG